MLKRRQFLGGLAAFGGSAFLAACGGGADDLASSAGAAKKATARVTSSAMSADGTSIPSGTSIIDGYGTTWTVNNGVVNRNGSPVGVSYNVALLLWYRGKMWHQNTSGYFYVCNDMGQWLPCSDPRVAVAATPGMFYGINGHFDYTYSPTQLVSILKNMGCNSYRVGCTTDPKQIGAVAGIAQALQGAGITTVVLINQSVYDANGNVFGSESDAYNAGYQAGSAVAKALAPTGVTIYECGNELTRQTATMLDFTNAGTKAVDFNNANWPAMRGVMRGMIDGVKSVQSSAKCGINFCVADIGAADALWDGQQPDGTSGYPTVRWDITTWHNYEVYGDIFNIGCDGSGPTFDVPTYCKARYGVPFMVTEWNTGPEQTQAYRANYISGRLGAYYSARKSDNIASVMYYVLDSGDYTFGVMLNGQQLNPPYSAMTSFIASNADN